jgi:uncharacterized paraquat-inducible protein A
MNKRFQFISICLSSVLLALVFAAWNGTGPGAAENKNFLADRHKGKGVECSACHNESPPKASVPMAACLKCHGSYAKVAKRTDNVSPNPHASPHVDKMGEIACEKCHHAHKPSVDMCAECHEFGYKVP